MRKIGPHLTSGGGLFFVLTDQSVASCKCFTGQWAKRVAQACVYEERRFKAALEQIIEQDANSQAAIIARTALEQTATPE